MTAAAPPFLNNKQTKYFTQLIKDNPLDKHSQNIIGAVKESYPALKDIVPTTSGSRSAQDYLAFTKRMEEYKNFEINQVFPASITSGNVIILADAHQNTFHETIEADLGNFMDNITKAGNFGVKLPSEINSVVNKISGTAKQFTGQIGNAVADKMVPFLSGGMDQLANRMFQIIKPYPAALAAVIAAQTSLISPIKGLFGAMDCLASKMTDALTNTIKDMITGLVKNVVNTAVCVAQQFIGALTSKIANMVDGFLSPFLGPIEKILSPIGAVFGIKNAILGGMNMFKKVSNLFRCESPPKLVASHKHTLDVGPNKSATQTEEKSKLDKAIAAASNANASLQSKKDGLLGGVSSGLSSFEENVGEWGIFGSKVKDSGNQGIGNCNTSNPFACGSPKIEFFGGGKGVGAAGEVILGNFINHLDPEDIYGDIKKTGSIIGVNITSPGEGYTEEPIIAFTDSCRQGYGAYGRATIDSNINSPTYGHVVNVVIVSEGENYPTDSYQIVDNVTDDDGNITQTTVLDGDNSEVYISDVIIDNPGTKYNTDDVIEGFDDLKLIVNEDTGQVINVEILEQLAYDVLPNLEVVSKNGFGLVLRPIMKIRTRTRPQEEVLQQVQCIGNFPRGED